MTLDEQLEQLAAMEYPHRVDVRDAVMQQVESLPIRHLHTARPSRPLWQRMSAAVAAVATLLLGVGIAMPYLRSYDDEGIAGTMAQLGDYSSWNTVEDIATDPYDYFYDQDI